MIISGRKIPITFAKVTVLMLSAVRFITCKLGAVSCVSGVTQKLVDHQNSEDIIIKQTNKHIHEQTVAYVESFLFYDLVFSCQQYID